MNLYCPECGDVILAVTESFVGMRECTCGRISEEATKKMMMDIFGDWNDEGMGYLVNGILIHIGVN